MLARSTSRRAINSTLVLDNLTVGTFGLDSLVLIYSSTIPSFRPIWAYFYIGTIQYTFRPGYCQEYKTNLLKIIKSKR